MFLSCPSSAFHKMGLKNLHLWNVDICDVIKRHKQARQVHYCIAVLLYCCRCYFVASRPFEGSVSALACKHRAKSFFFCMNQHERVFSRCLGALWCVPNQCLWLVPACGLVHPLLSWRFLGETPPPTTTPFHTLLIGDGVGGLPGSCVLSGPPGEPTAYLIRTKETKQHTNRTHCARVDAEGFMFSMKLEMKIDLWKIFFFTRCSPTLWVFFNLECCSGWNGYSTVLTVFPFL